MSSRTPPRPLTPVDLPVLRAVNRFRYLTAAQLGRLLWPDNTGDANRYSQRRLKRLTDQQYLLPLRDLPRPAVGTAPRVYALAWRGRQALLAQGEAVPVYYRPSEERAAARNPVFLPHTLAVIDVLVALERFTQQEPDMRLTHLLAERELRQLRLPATVPAIAPDQPNRRLAVVPDALFTLQLGQTSQHFLLELDRGTERQQYWRDKVAALTLWIAAPASRTLLPSPYTTVMVVTPTARRRDALRTWTAEELRIRGLFDEHASLFAVTAASPATMTPRDFFTSRHWLPPYLGTPDSLLDLPTRTSHRA